MPTLHIPENLLNLARHARHASPDVLRGHVVNHVSRELGRKHAVEYAMTLVDAFSETPGAPAVKLFTGRKEGVSPRVYFPGTDGYVTIGWDGSVLGASVGPGHRGALTFNPGALRPVQRRAYRQAMDRYRESVVALAEEHDQERVEKIEELLAELEEAVAVEEGAERAAWQEAHEGGRGRANPDEDDLPPLVEDADYHRIYEPEDFHWDVGYHWTSRAKAEKVLREGFFAPLHFFEGHESGPIYASVISSEAAREVDRTMRKKFGPDLVLGQRTYDHFASVLYDAVKKHHPEWNRLWYGKNPEDSSSYGDTCLRIDLRGIGEWIRETGRDAIETEDYTYGNGLFVDAKIPARFFSIHEGDEDERANPALADLPVVDTEEWDDGTVVEYLALPFPYERKPLRHRGDPSSFGMVPLEGLIATQHRVSRAGVQRAGDAPITVLETHDGRRYIADGHHRAVAAWLRGDDAIEAEVVRVRE